jgi:hypothetical protein
MPETFSWPKVLIVTGGLAAAAFGGLSAVGTYMLVGVNERISALGLEAGEQLSGGEQESDAILLDELAATMQELRGEIAALRKEITGLGGRIVASNDKVRERIDARREELAVAVEKQGERLAARLDRLDRNTIGSRNEIGFFRQDSVDLYPKPKVAPAAPLTIPEATP